MSRLSFRAWRGKHYVGLPQLLCVLGGLTADAVWELDLEDVAPGPQGDHLSELAGGARVSTRELLLAAFPDGQIIDGRLRAFATPDATDPMAVLHAVDSSEWDVESADPAVSAAVREAFPDAVNVD